MFDIWIDRRTVVNLESIQLRIKFGSLIMFLLRFDHLLLICTNASFRSSIWAENLIVFATINVELHRLVNSFYKKPQCMVHNSSHDLYQFIACPAGTFCFFWPLRTAFSPFCVCYSQEVLKTYLPLWFIHPEIPILSDVPVKDASVDKAGVSKLRDHWT